MGMIARKDIVGLCATALVALGLAGCAREQPKAPKPPDTAAVSNAIVTITSVFAADGDFRRLDVREMRVADFRRVLEGVSPKATLWMPGECDWLLLGTKAGCTNSLSAAMERFAGLDTRLSFPQTFCDYVGTVAETLPAFAALAPKAVVAPQNFVTREIPNVGWLATDDVDADIRERTLQEMRSMQLVRRIVLQGNMKALVAKDKKGEEAAIDEWAKAVKRNPDDTMLAERMERLSRNARAFLELRRFLQALKCYETLVLIRPTAVNVHNFGMCLKKLGKRDLAERALARARELERAENSAQIRH